MSIRAKLLLSFLLLASLSFVGGAASRRALRSIAAGMEPAPLETARGAVARAQRDAVAGLAADPKLTPAERARVTQALESAAETVARDLATDRAGQHDESLFGVGSTTILAAGLTLLIALAFAWTLSGRFTGPILALTAVTRDIAAGQLVRRVEVSSADEIGQLAASFNGMAEALFKAEGVRSQRDFMHGVMAAMGDALTVVDGLGHIRTVNEATCRLLGYKEEELIGRPIDAYVLAGDDAAIEWTASTVLRDVTVRYLTRDRSVVPMSLSMAPMHDADGQLLGMVGVARDMREHLSLLADSEARKRMGERSRNIISSYTAEASSDSFFEGIVGAVTRSQVDSRQGALREP